MRVLYKMCAYYRKWCILKQVNLHLVGLVHIYKFSAQIYLNMNANSVQARFHMQTKIFVREGVNNPDIFIS